jgi:hypothetical protein
MPGRFAVCSALGEALVSAADPVDGFLSTGSLHVLPDPLPVRDRTLTAYHADIGTPSRAYIYCLFNGRIVSINEVERGASSTHPAVVPAKAGTHLAAAAGGDVDLITQCLRPHN